MASSSLLSIVWTVTLGHFSLPSVTALDNGLARTPQMGWDNWNALGCDVSEDLLKATAQKIVDYGFRDVGYHYVVMDDCWSAGRDKNGVLVANSTRFPNGIKHVADSIHSLGLGYGMYSDAGSMTCGQFMGSLGYEDVDAKTFAGWGVDYLKYDNCYNEGQSGTPQITYNRYKKMQQALNATGRPILYSLCNWGEDYPWKWAQTIANSWRMSGDIFDQFDLMDDRCPCSGDQGYDCALPGFHCSMMNILNKVAHFPDKGIRGAWNDMDMLEVGNGGMADEEYKTHFSLWAALKSPLIMGNDVRKITPSSLSILQNPAVIAVNQDPEGSSVFRRWRYKVDHTTSPDGGEIQMWSGTLAHGDFAVLLLNAGKDDRDMNATLADIFVDQGPNGMATQAKMAWDVYDLWGWRMDDVTAGKIINGTYDAKNVTSPSQMRYNATEWGGYAKGLAANNTLLMGKMIGTVPAGGKLTAHVKSHGVGFFRLRPHQDKKKRDEL